MSDVNRAEQLLARVFGAVELAKFDSMYVNLGDGLDGELMITLDGSVTIPADEADDVRELLRRLGVKDRIA